MKTCILMPVHNEELFVSSAISSILSQEYSGSLSLIVVDDGSTDNTATIVEQIASETGVIKLVRCEQRGVTKTRNTLLSLIPDDCEFVMFLDGDDAYPDGRIARDLSILAANPNLDLVYGNLHLVHSTKQHLALDTRSDDAIVRGIQMAAGTYRRALISKIGMFDTSYEQAEDTDYLLRLFESDPSFELVDETSVYYRRHAGNITNDVALQRRVFLKALLAHSKRKKENPNIASVNGIFNMDALSRTNGN